MTPATPVKAHHRLMLKLVEMDAKKFDPTPAELEVVGHVFAGAGGSWKRLFEGSVADTDLLKRVLAVAIKENRISKKPSWGVEAARPIPIPKQNIKELSKEISRAVAQKVPATDKPLGNHHVLKAPYSVTRADGVHLDFQVVIESKAMEPGLFVDGGGAGIHPQIGPFVVIFLNGGFSGNQYRKSINGYLNGFADQLYSTLIHEMTHLADPQSNMQSGRKSMPVKHYEGEVPTDADLRAYVNDPREVRAHMQQIVDEIEEKFKYADKLQGHFGLSGGMVYLLKMSSKWREIESYLSVPNRKYIIKAVAVALQKWRDDNQSAV